MKNFGRSILVGALAALGLCAICARAEDKFSWDGSQPAPGVYFYWYEPSFYTGFAPRTQDRNRVHLELGRGNQQRMTIVLGPAEQDAYLENLLARRDTVKEMVAKGVITLTTNKEFERFDQGLRDAGVEQAVASKATLGQDAYRAKSVEVMEKLNPQRVFHIRIPVDRVASQWHAALSGLGPEGNRLDAANAALPGRVNATALDAAVEAQLDKALALVRSGKGPGDPAFRDQTIQFVQTATGGRYTVTGGQVSAIEFTAIYPAGTVKAWSQYKGRRLPEFGVSGVWTLIPREHGKGIMGMVDYLSTNPGYGFIPLLGYQYAGGITYNALHNAGVRSQLGSTRFLPREWIRVPGERNPKRNYQNLWIASRGPTSHGCTRLPSGHMSELRDALPSSSEGLEGVRNFRNKPECYDVFDIDGDGTEEVMGVQYYLAYWGVDHTPVAAYAPNDRKGFYAWLYGDNIAYGSDGRATIEEVPVCRFTGLHNAAEARVLHNVPLYEAPFARESIQFYTIRRAAFDSRAGFTLNREMRRIGAGYTVNRRALLLE